MSKKEDFCPHCGAKTVEYRHKFNKHMAKGLILLDQMGGVGKLKELTQLTYNQRNNFQKLQYWGFIEKTGHESNWRVTDLGKNVLENRIVFDKYAVTYRSEVKRMEGPAITIEDALGDYAYWYREQYWDNRVKE